MTPKKKTRVRQLVGFLIALAAILGMVGPIYHNTKPVYDEKDYYSLDAGWDAVAHGEEYRDVVLSEKLFPMFNKGDELILTRQLPAQNEVPNPVLQLYSVHSAIAVYLDEELIYSYGQDEYAKGNFIGYGYNYVALPADYPGKELKVVFDVTENTAFEGIPAMEIHNGATAMRNMLAAQRVNIVIVGFLMLFGILGMLISLVMIFRNQAFFKTFCITAFAFLTGTWTFCNGDLITLFVANLHVKVFMEYSSFYLLLLPFLCYFYDNFAGKKVPKAMRIYYFAVLGADCVFILMTFGLQVANLVHFQAFVTCQHVLMVFAMIVVLMAGIYEAKCKGTFFSTIIVGFGIAVVLAGIELVRFNMNKYVVGFANNKYDSRMQLAALIIVITLFFDFCNRVTARLYEDAQTKLLKKMAYVDELTQLANRRKCDEVLDGLSGMYTIVSLDMNSLKYINDTFGHDYGDRAIQAFATCIRKAFPKEVTVGRMGGDEFIAIAPGMDEAAAKSCVDAMNGQMAAYNIINNEPFKLSAAWGIAQGKGSDNPREIYTAADQKMYDCKRLMKKAIQNNQ